MENFIVSKFRRKIDKRNEMIIKKYDACKSNGKISAILDMIARQHKISPSTTRTILMKAGRIERRAAQ